MPGDQMSALSIQNLKFRYPDQPAGAPWNVSVSSLEVARGEQVLLTAASGHGKSTLLQVVAGLLDPAEGTVSIAGTRVHDLHGAARDLFRGRHIGMIFQTFNLLHGFSALENVMAALMFSTIPPREHKDRAAALLKHLGIDRVDADPDRLSVGQQQRVAVARAVVCDPVLVLADEPTASLDPENASTAIQLIQDACREKNAALVCVSHDPAMGERFERRESLDRLAGRPLERSA
ncbi:MAG: Vitamin B12 import ATP-binding protein BtuD [Phycisphaerales bacterium]|nr:Vitamin B12 import ATP-binding protein BtuD [Phycisphaerales bacterium]